MGGCDDSVVRNCYITKCGHYAIHSGEETYRLSTVGNYIYDNGSGIGFGSTIYSIVKENIITGTFYTHGLYWHASYNNIISGNIFQGCAMSGIQTSNTRDIISNNQCYQNNQSGITITGERNQITGNVCIDNDYQNTASYDGIFVSGNFSVISDNICKDNDRYEIHIASGCDKTIVANNMLDGTDREEAFYDEGTLTQVSGNYPSRSTEENKFILVKNTSGGELVAGDVVILKSVAAGNEVTTTTAQGDDKVFGMVTETIANDASGLIQTVGKTVSLKVDGTADIAVGDLLGTYTAAGIAMKAAAGDMAFAIALEAYATDDSSGVIDALLITPRKL